MSLCTLLSELETTVSGAPMWTGRLTVHPTGVMYFGSTPAMEETLLQQLKNRPGGRRSASTSTSSV